MVSNNALMGIAGIGGLALGITGMYVLRSAGEGVRRSPYYEAALSELQRSPAARAFLGEPVQTGRFELDHQDDCYCDGERAHFRVPVWGPRAKGLYWFWAERNAQGWQLTRAEIEPAEDPTRRLVILKQCENLTTSS